MVIEHELMHQETLLYMLQELALDRKVRPAWLPRDVTGRGRPPATVQVPAGTATLGAAFTDLAFGWDNEFPPAQVFVPGFRIDETPVTNGQFLAFVDDGGYGRRELWAADDWGWNREETLAHPRVWTNQDGRWLYRGLFDLLPLERVMDWPVYVSLAEARAYARWRGLRLPTEAEFHRAAFGDPRGPERAFPWGAGAPGERHGNFDFRHWAPTPVGTYPEGASAWGVYDLVGNGWEWTETPFDGLCGFRGVDPRISRLLSRFLRRQALCPQGRFVGDRRGACTAELPQLVPGALFVRVRHVSLCREPLIPIARARSCVSLRPGSLGL